MTNTENKTPVLPSKSDKLFTSETDWWNNACLNFLSEGWTLYSFAYKEAGDIIAKHVISERSLQDALVYPLLFLYRQYLELEMKDLIQQTRRLLDINEPFPKSHRIDELWAICRKLIGEVSPGDDGEALKEVGRLIEEFTQVDPLSMAFRYPEDKDGNPSLPGMSYINLRNVSEVINKISVLLEGAGTMVREYLSYKRDCGPHL
jgi:hypothetical protein